MTNATYTHKVYFKKPTLAPVLLTQEQANVLIQARQSSDYDPKDMTTVGTIQCEMGELGLIEKLDNSRKIIGSRYCNNAKCNNENKTHKDGTLCDYDMTGNCSKCGTSVIEKTREYSMFKWGKELCYNCSPFGHASEIFPGEPSVELSRMRGVAAHYIDKGLEDNEVVEAVNQNLTSKIGEGITR